LTTLKGGVPLLGHHIKKSPLILLSFHQGAAVFVSIPVQEAIVAGALREPFSVGLLRVDP
jgi:hypothetical protein